MRQLFLVIFLFFISYANVAHAQILAGPMLGYNTMREAMVWIQLEKEATLFFEYYALDKEENRHSEVVSTSDLHANTAHLIAKDLDPGTTYFYSIRIGNSDQASVNGTFTTQTLWQHRTDPPAFSFALGSCAYINEKAYDRPGEPYGSGYEIFERIADMKPRFMLWLGDNIYLREADWSSKSGIYQRYTHFKSLPQLQKLWKNMHHYAIWDDHDFGPNDANSSFINKDISLEAFKDFWGNMSYGIDGDPGITHQFSFNDLDFFLLDNRYFRSPNNRLSGKKQILGDAQIEWLIDALKSSDASFKIVAIGGQFLSPAAVYENHATFPDERARILQLIEKEAIKNVVFLSGDRHKTELTKMTLPNGHLLYDFTCSPLTSKAYNTFDEGNNLRVEGTHVSTQNFGIINVSGKLNERILTLQSFNKEGEVQWEKKITQQ